MIGLSRRSAIAASAVLVASGCYWFGASDREPASARVESAEIASHTPPLSAFALRVAVADLPLDAHDSALATQLEHECEPWMQKIDQARELLVDVLVRDVEQHRFDASAAKAAADRVVAATDEAAPHLDAALVKLHDALDPWQQRSLEQNVRARFLGWSTEWNARSATDHPWLATLAEPALAAGATIDRDLHETAQHWVDSIIEDVGAKAPAVSFGDADRRDLIDHLRSADVSP